MNFSLYRGNLHKVSDVPRRWALAKPSIPLHVFQKAIAKRNEAMQRLHASPGQAECDALNQEPEQEALNIVAENDGPLHDEEHGVEQGKKRKREDVEGLAMEMEEDDIKCDEDAGNERKPRLHSDLDPATTENMALEDMDCDSSLPPVICEAANQGQINNGNGAAAEIGRAKQPLLADNNPEGMDISVEKESERLEAPRTPAVEDEEGAKPTERMSRGLDGCVPLVVSSAVEPSVARRKAEIQEKLKQLRETKHQLVQILKQVLTSEEEAKRKSQLLQYPAAYSTVGAVDFDQKTGSEMQSGDLEEGELEYTRISGPAIASSTYSGHFCPQPLMMSTSLGRQFTNSQLSNKP